MPAALNQPVGSRDDFEIHLPNHTWQQRSSKQGIVAYVRGGSIGALAAAPIIYSLILPLALLDLWVTLYQWVCFPVYRMAGIRRGRFIALDRHRLPYLNGIERLNCTFCSYANGVLAYAREVAARTEQYWCPIKHARRIAGAHRRYARFHAFGDGRGYHHGLTVHRRALRAGRPARRRRKVSRS